MKKHLIIVLFVLASLLTGACSSVATSTPVSDLSGGYPLSTKTGVEVVDNVLAAVAAGNTEELRSLIQYTAAPCTTAEGMGGPPKCNEGEPEGQTLQVLPFLGSEGSFIRRSEIGNWDGINAAAVYAVYRVSESARREEYYPSGEYAIIFLGPPNELGVSVRIGSKGIVRVDYLFDTSPEGLKLAIERDASEVILAPKFR